MKKAEAIKFFASVSRLSKALHISSQAVSQWPEKLPIGMADRVRGAALRYGYSTAQIIKLDPKAPGEVE